MSVVISARNVSKLFLITRQNKEKYHTLRDTVVRRLRGFAGRFSKDRLALENTDIDEFWALSDVGFDIHQGERIGLIGRNGAGKSTLLKILGRITEPTTGSIRIRGRMASLLEVGTGFHPELTGRENVWLSGAIYGLSRKDIANKFDEIVEFAEIEQFLETPVKRYSSGMYVRLAFAVAAHLNPDILVMDEVLAVGDLHFQKKCLSKMGDVAAEGHTLILVSHNMSTILGMSTRCLLLDRGRLVADGIPPDVIRYYQNTVHDASFGQSDLTSVERYGTGAARFESIRLAAETAERILLEYPECGCDIVFEVILRAQTSVLDAIAALIIYDELGNRLVDVNSLIKGQAVSLAPDEKVIICFRLKNVRLKPSLYTVGLWFGIQNVADFDGIRYATSFRMEARREDILYTAPFPGVYMCEFEYSSQKT